MDLNNHRLASCIWGSLELKWGFSTFRKRAGLDNWRERERESKAAVSWSGWTWEPCGHFHLVIHSWGGMSGEAEPTSAYLLSNGGCLMSLARQRAREWADVSKRRGTRWKEMSEKNVTNRKRRDCVPEYFNMAGKKGHQPETDNAWRSPDPCIQSPRVGFLFMYGTLTTLLKWAGQLPRVTSSTPRKTRQQFAVHHHAPQLSEPRHPKDTDIDWTPLIWIGEPSIICCLIPSPLFIYPILI